MFCNSPKPTHLLELSPERLKLDSKNALAASLCWGRMLELLELLMELWSLLLLVRLL